MRISVKVQKGDGMKRILAVVVLVCMVFSFATEGMGRTEKKNLYSVLSDQKEVKTYVADITDSSGAAGDMLVSMKKRIVNALKARQTINFQIVEDIEDADLVIKCNINERIWLKVDPVDQVHGIGAAAADIALQENYGRMQADFTVERGPRKVIFKRLRRLTSKPVLWESELQATVTKMVMPEEESKPLLEERMAEVFIRKCFSKRTKLTH